MKRTFFFPESTFGRSYSGRRAEIAARLFGETRRLPRRKGTEANIRLLVEDMILGPVDPMHVRLLPSKTTLLGLIWRKRAVYLNFSVGILSPDKNNELSLPLILQGITNTIIFNFPSVRRVFVFIEGEIPDFAGFEGPGSKDYSDGLGYDPSVFY